MKKQFQYSEGEKYVQKHAGVQLQANRLTGIVRTFVGDRGQDFITDQRFFFISSLDNKGKVWTSIILGTERGFLNFYNTEQIEINKSAIDLNKEDILYQNIKANPNVGLLFIEFANRRRFRINGKITISKDKIHFDIEQAFPNCPKYIQARSFKKQQRKETIASPSKLDLGTIKKIIEKSDTFIMGTVGKNGGVDTSHRGGNTGFLEFINENTFRIPDYSGNNMFTSLGNIIENPNTGMIFIGFEKGATLQLTGKSKLNLDERDLSNGIERYWYFTIEDNIYTENVLPIEWSQPRFSPLNPRIV